MPICPWHKLIAHKLKTNDVVVNFNYDSIMSYALLNEKKLSKSSFLNSHVNKIDIKADLLSDAPVVLLNPHGSFTWYQDITLRNYHDGMKYHLSKEFSEVMEEYNRLEKPISDDKLSVLNKKLNPLLITVGLNCYPPEGNYTMSSVILPLKKKKQIFDYLPLFKEEYQLFLDKLKEATEIHLIGKQFKNSDQDIADDIKTICQKIKKKHIIFVNPDSENLEWLKYHKEIFNVESYASFSSLKDYAEYISVNKSNDLFNRIK